MKFKDIFDIIIIIYYIIFYVCVYKIKINYPMNLSVKYIQFVFFFLKRKKKNCEVLNVKNKIKIAVKTKKAKF